MYSLFYVKFNWYFFAGLSIAIYLIFPQLSVYSFLAILISIHQFILLFNSLGHVIPVRYLFGFLMCLQLLIGPMLAYNGLDQYQIDAYKMKVPESLYFSYIIPAVLLFIFGLHLYAKKLDGEQFDREEISKFLNKHQSLPYIFIAVGFVSSLVAEFFSSDLAFVFILIGGFKFIGLLLILVGNIKLKVMPFIIVVGSIISSSLGNGMFHDLLTWLIFIGSVLAIKFKPTMTVKVIAIAGFILLAIIIQQSKSEYRSATWQRGEEAGVATFARAYEENQQNNLIFDPTGLAKSNVRINQGYIITNIMKTVPDKVPFTEGQEMSQILKSAVLPRILAPEKLSAGDMTLFKKYSGMQVSKGTSMALSSVGDAYVNFGIIGGCLFMLALGLFYSQILCFFFKSSQRYPVLPLFVPLVFYYPIRPDCDLQTILGHLIKACFLIFILMAFGKSTFKVRSTSNE